MMGLYVCLGVQRTQRFTFAGTRVRIGAADDNDLVLRDGEVDEHACTVERTGDACTLDRGDGPSPILDGADFEVGDYMLVLALTDRVWRRLDVTEAIEQRLIDSILARDDASRLVYADWLEEHGHVRRAEFLRIQEVLSGARPDAPGFVEQTRRLRVLSTMIDIRWRRQISRTNIEGCFTPGAFFGSPSSRVALEGCPRRWSELDPTEDPKLRECGSCNESVYYCATMREAESHAFQGHRVAVDATVDRRPNDLTFRNEIPVRRF